MSFEALTKISRVERLWSSLHTSVVAHITLCFLKYWEELQQEWDSQTVWFSDKSLWALSLSLHFNKMGVGITSVNSKAILQLDCDEDISKSSCAFQLCAWSTHCITCLRWNGIRPTHTQHVSKEENTGYKTVSMVWCHVMSHFITAAEVMLCAHLTCFIFTRSTLFTIPLQLGMTILLSSGQ